MINHRRSEIQIVAEILRLVQSGACKTRIMYHADLSYSQVQRYLSFLNSHGFITRLGEADLPAIYRTTESGLRLLKGIENVSEMLGSEDYETYAVHQS